MTIAIHNQTSWDIAIQQYGSIEAVFDLLNANDLALADDLRPGQVLKTPESLNADQEIASYYSARELHPATKPQADEYEKGGIGYMGININFKVS